MWAQPPEELYRLQTDHGAEPLPDLHRPIGLPDVEEEDVNENRGGDDEKESRQTTPSDAGRGMWGERDEGGPVDQQAAMLDFEELRKELTTRSRATDAEGAHHHHQPSSSSFFGRTMSWATGTKSHQQHGGKQDEAHDEEKGISETPSAASANGEDDEFALEAFMREGYFERRTEDGSSGKKLGVVFRNLTVRGVASQESFVRTLPDAVIGTFGPDLYRLICRVFPVLDVLRRGKEVRDLIHDFTGVVRAGEMMLVLGRPGSGCSTFLKAVANSRDSFAEVLGDVRYGGIPAAEQARQLRGEVVYNPEQDVHMPSLSVWQSLQFALLTKTRKARRADVSIIVDALLRMFAIRHTARTVVGNEFVRGVSGGERKRVSIAETLATKGTVACWDNSTRGLDASTALDYARSLRVMTDVSHRTTITTLYQAGEEIYRLMDKVLVIEQGRIIFQGPAAEARQYFVDLGFHAPERQTTPDFLTSIGDAGERQFLPGMEAACPKTPAELEAAFRRSDHFRRVQADVEAYEAYLAQTGYRDAEDLRRSVREQKSRHVQHRSPYTVSFPRQVMVCTRREFWLIWGDKTSLYTKFWIIVSVGLIVSSLFYHQPSNTAGAFSRGGTVFFSILFLGWLALTELIKAVSGRAVISRHREYAFYRPSAVVVARVLTDFPMILAQVVPFGLILYFMTGLTLEPGRFFIYLLFIYTTTFCLTSLYRMFAALVPGLDDAVRFAGIAFNLLIIYTGYVIPKTELLGQKIWFGWLYWVNPVSYAFEGVLSNEFHGRVMECAAEDLVPRGPLPGEVVGPPYQGCALAGAGLDATRISGDTYIAASFGYSYSNLWRNFGVLVAFTILYILVTMLATETFTFLESGDNGGGALIFKRTGRAKKEIQEASAPTKSKDEESRGTDGDAGVHSRQGHQEHNQQDEALNQLSPSESVFTWTDVSYTVSYPSSPDGQRRLLDGVSGYAKPGVMVALMGTSGAGKTTLLNTLSQRQRTGQVKGSMLVDGKPLPLDFQRNTGYVEQMDLHDSTATVREALEFAAVLRQERDVSRAEKLAYVDRVIDLLELREIQDAVIMSLGVEHRKRVTIGVELAARPGLLLFLDEPTSGLDSQSAFSIVRFLRKLCAAGQAVICTIHQPSSELIQQFDMILALRPGGQTFYFGPVGDNGSAVVDYFAKRGVDCPPDKNVAEFILETAVKGRVDWNLEWLESEENKAVIEEIRRIQDERSKVTGSGTGSEQHQQSGFGKEAAVIHAYAAPVWTQTVMLTMRMFRQHWRDPSYIYGKLFVSVIIGIFNGFTFWKVGNTVQDLQDRMFSAFLIIIIPPTIVNGVVPRFYQNLSLWTARELPSRTYGWVAFCTASAVTEIPSAIVCGTIYWALWYWPAGLGSAAPASGYVYLMTLLFFLFQASWGQWICAFAPSFTVISNVLPFFFVMHGLFNGIVVPYAQLNIFWRSWMYWLNPAQYWISGVVAATLPGIHSVQCAAQEAAYFSPPPGMTCAQYAADFVSEVAHRGYLTNPDDTANCGYCPYATGTEYMALLNVTPGDKWRDFGVYLAFVISNWALIYFFVWTVRIKGWTFGFGPLFRGIGRGVDLALAKRK